MVKYTALFVEGVVVIHTEFFFCIMEYIFKFVIGNYIANYICVPKLLWDFPRLLWP